METLLSFFSDLILFTAGLAVALFWIVLICAIIIEVADEVRDRKPADKNEVDF